MKLTIADLLDAEAGLNAILGRQAAPDGITLKQAYWLQKTQRLITQELRDFRALNGALIKKYGKEDDKGEWSIDQTDTKALKKYYADYDELVAQEVEINVQPVVSSSQLSALKPPMSVLAALWFLMTDWEEGD